jgi:hypothetical protein
LSNPNSGSKRRSFVRKLLGLAAIGGASTLLLGVQLPPVAAVGELSGSGTSGQVAYWANPSQIAGFPSILNSSNGSIVLGIGNTASGDYTTVGGGTVNTAGSGYATVGGGQSNTAGGGWATVAGGVLNTASGTVSTIGGGQSNMAGGVQSTIGGGDRNVTTGQWATVAGGHSGAAMGVAATVGGGVGNTAGVVPGNLGDYATVAGGAGNSATGNYATVGGGNSGSATGGGATVCGGCGNLATGPGAFVGGGGYDGVSSSGNLAIGNASTIGGGLGNVVSGSYATVPGGFGNEAGGDNSFAAGSFANVQAAHHGTTLFSDDTGVAGNFVFNSAAPDEFAVRAAGGVRLVTAVDLQGVVTRMVDVSSSGYLGVSTNVGNGVFTPEYAFDLRTPGSSSAQMHIASSDTDAGGYLTSANAGNLFMSAGAAWNGSAWVAKNGSAYQYGGGTAGVRFFFDTGLTIGSTYTPTTRMFIGPTGHVGIGMSTAPGHLLQLGLDDAAKPSTNTWTIASDGRLKDPESIEPFTEGSELIKRLPQPVWFRYRKESGLPSDRRVAGWIAQDVAQVAPFMVRRTKQKLSTLDSDETETLSLNTNELPYAMLNTIREMLGRQEEMMTGISELKARLVKLENRDA